MYGAQGPQQLAGCALESASGGGGRSAGDLWGRDLGRRGASAGAHCGTLACPVSSDQPSGLADWDRLTVLFDSPPAMRRALSTTNAIESLHYTLRKVLKGRGAFPNDEAIVKLFYRCSGLLLE